MKRRDWTVVALALAWGLVAAVAGYAVIRTAQAFDEAPVVAVTTTASAHIPYYWRMIEAGYAGGMVALGVALVGRRATATMSSALVPGVAVAAGLLLLQSLVWP